MAKKNKRSGKSGDKNNDREMTSSEIDSAIEELDLWPNKLPLVPTRDMVAFPNVMLSLYLSRPAGILAVEQAMQSHRLVLLVAQRNQDVEDPAPRDLYKVGVVAHLVRSLQVPDGRYKVLLQGVARARIERCETHNRIYLARHQPLKEKQVKKLTRDDLNAVERIRENLQILVQHEHLPEEMLLVTEEVTDPGVLSDLILAHYKLELGYAQTLLEELDPIKRLKVTNSIIQDDLNQFIVTEKIRDQTRDEMTRGQREYYLREQIKQIQRELGESDGVSEDLIVLKQRIDAIKLPEHAREEVQKQFKRLERMSPESSEYALLRTYMDWIVEIPWDKRTKDKLNLKTAKKVLDEDHCGLEKVKDRILEYLSVKQLSKSSAGPILCFVGPPGVGKTSLGKSIARSLGRKFTRMSLGGIRDEAEIRGHRRTYVGALPGRILQGLKQAGSVNPVFMLDELDKIGADFRGDPASALLEVLDPQQNKDFADHYLSIGYDLSETLFVATANTLDTIPDALLDRLEVIFIPGYTTEEKVRIARQHLIKRQIEENGIAKSKIEIKDDALLYLIERYTREAGVRSLEREIAALCRKVAREVAEKGKAERHITVQRITTLLGPTKYDPELTDQREAVGLVRGLAWTVVGGEVMPVEASVAKGSGALALTGQLGSIMQESAQAALFYARANAKQLGLDIDFHEKFDMHIHVPGGATPKDGPSAGITIATALVSALSHRKVSRDIAMTGEMTLRGNVLAIGGLREKALAALRFGITRIIIPQENVKDLEEIPEQQRKLIEFIPVSHVSEVLEKVLLAKEKEAIKPLKKRGINKKSRSGLRKKRENYISR